MAKQSKPIYDDVNKCVKDKPELGPCLCPDCMANMKPPQEKMVEKGLVLTDTNLVSPNAVSMVSWHFKCAECGCGYVGDYMSYCPDCGVRVIIRSHKVFEFLKHLKNNQRI